METAGTRRRRPRRATPSVASTSRSLSRARESRLRTVFSLISRTAAISFVDSALEVRELERDLIVERNAGETFAQQLAALRRATLRDRTGPRSTTDETESRSRGALAEVIGEPAPRDREQVRLHVLDPVARLDAREERLRDQICAVVADLRAKEPRRRSSSGARPAPRPRGVAAAPAASRSTSDRTAVYHRSVARPRRRAAAGTGEEHALRGERVARAGPPRARGAARRRRDGHRVRRLRSAARAQASRSKSCAARDARVLAEARALAKLSHPNVVAVYDADEVDGVVFIVMEHVDRHVAARVDRRDSGRGATSCA